MAHQEEPMDVDSSICEFDNKENAYQHGNVQPKTPCTEKGYEELDVTELNMKLRYSVTPSGSPMSKSFTANIDDRTFDCSTNNAENTNMTHSLHSTLNKSAKSLPLQRLATEQTDGNRSVLRPLESTATFDNIAITVSTPNENDDVSIPSSTSSLAHTPEATTPTNGIAKDEASPIMRGLKSVLNMFRPSQSPIPPEESSVSEVLSPPIVSSPSTADNKSVIVSTPLAARNASDKLTKRTSPIKENFVFKEDLEKELLWKDESTVIFAEEKAPLHKLFFQNVKLQATPKAKAAETKEDVESTVEYMDISYNDSMVDNTLNAETQQKLDKSDANIESDSEFVDCETTFNKNESLFSAETSLEYVDINLDSTKDIVDRLTELSDDTVNGSTDTLEASTKSADLSNTTILVEPKDGTLEMNVAPSCSVDTLVDEESPKVEENAVKENEPILAEINLTEEQHILDEVKQNIEAKAADPAHVSLSLADTCNDSPIISYPDKCTVKTPAIKELVDDATMPKLDVVIDSVNSTVDTDNIVINSLAQIPLIADPRVLLFNISSEATVEEVFLQNLNPQALPTGVPLPDDDDVASLPPIVQDNHDVAGQDVSQSIIMEGSLRSLVLSKKLPGDSAIEELNVFNLPSETGTVMTKQGSEVVIGEKYVEQKISTQQLVNESVEDTSTCKMLEVNVLADALQVVTQASIAPIIQNSLESETAITEVTQVDLVATLSENDENIRDNTPIPNFAVIAQQENKGHEPINRDSPSQIKEVSELFDVINCSNSSDQKVVSISVNDNVTPKYEPILSNDNASIMEVESKPLTIDIPQSPKPENYVAPVSDLVIEGSVQETPPDCTVHQENSKPLKVKIQDHVIKTIPASVVAKCRDSLDKKEIEATKSSVFLIESQTPASNEVVGPKSDEQLSTNNVTLEDKVLSDDVIDLYPTESILAEPVMEISSQVLTSNIVITEALGEIKPSLDPVAIKKPYSELSQSGLSPVGQEEFKLINVTDKIVAKTETTNKSTENIVKVIPVNDFNCDVSMVDITSNKTDETFFSSVKCSEVPGKDIIDISTNQQSSIVPLSASGPPSVNKELIDEEVVASENNSPFVSVTTEIDCLSEQIPLQQSEVEANTIENFEEVVNHLSTDSKGATPPKSPAIVSKGYNFNFDEMEDPFATKTKIRQSPPPETSPNQSFTHLDDTLPIAESPKAVVAQNKRPVPQKRRPIRVNRKLGSTAATVDKVNKPAENSKTTLLSKEDHEEPALMNQNITGADDTVNKDNEGELPIHTGINKCTDDELKGVNVNDEHVSKLDSNIMISDNKVTSSDETTNYTEISSKVSKNIFDIHEIDDPNFNPFATKTKIQKSPPPSLNGTFDTVTSSPPKTKTCKDDIIFIKDTEKLLSPIAGETTEDDSLDKDYLDNSNPEVNVTCLFKTSTMATATTADADTIEGPFLDDIDFKDDDEIDFNSENIGTFEHEYSPPGNSDNAEGEMFIDAEAFEFLLNQNKTSTVADSGKESLFLKFDPLFAKRVSSVGVSAALYNMQTRLATPKKGGTTPQRNSTLIATPQTDATFVATPQRNITFTTTPQQDVTLNETVPQEAIFVAPTQGNAKLCDLTIPGPSKLNLTDADASNATEESNDDLNVTIAKPMMVVNPAVNPIVTPRIKATTPNRRSLTFTSPAIAVIDRLLSISANNSLLGPDTSVRDSQDNNEADQALIQLRELLADKEIDVHNLRTESKDLRERLSNLESQIKNLEAISQERLKKINELNEKLNQKTQMNKRMAKVVEEYERTIASLITETEQDKKRHAEERLQLINEREEATSHLASMEVSFSDLHSKYEKSKQVIFGFKANEDSLKKSVKDFEENVAKMQSNYETLKQHATAKLNHANDELQKINRAHEAEVLKLNAMIKRKEVDITSLEETLAQKTKTNQELAAICDSLLAKFG